MAVTETVEDGALASSELKTLSGEAAAKTEDVREKTYTLGKSYDTTSGKIVTMTSRAKDGDLPSPSSPPHPLRSIPDQTATAVKIIPVDTEDELSDPAPMKPVKPGPPPVSAKPVWTPPSAEVSVGVGVVKAAVAALNTSEDTGDMEKSDQKLLMADAALGDRTSPLMRSPLRSPLKTPAMPQTPEMPRLSPGAVSYLARTPPTARVVV